MKLGKLALFAGALALACATPSFANTVMYTTVAGSDSDGPLAATIAFQAVSGGLEVTVTNTETGTLAKGQAISTFGFTVSGISAPTFFTELSGVAYNPVSGTSWTLASGAAFDDTSNAPPVNGIDHWGFAVTGSGSLLATAGSPVPGSGNPHYMILPASGTAGPGSSLANSNFDPFIIGPGNFFLTVPGITATTNLLSTNFTGITVGFGTGPDQTLGTTYTTTIPSVGSTVPLPSAAWAGLTMLLPLGFIAWRRRRTARTLPV